MAERRDLRVEAVVQVVGGIGTPVRVTVDRSAPDAAAGEAMQHAVRRHLQHDVVLLVRDVQVAGRVECHAARQVELRLHRRHAVGRRTERAVPDDRRDRSARRVEPPDARVPAVGDDDVAGAVDDDVARRDQHRLRAGATVTDAAPGEGRDVVAGLCARPGGSDDDEHEADERV